MGDTSQGQLSIVKELVPGSPPANPAFKVIDFVDEDLVQTFNTVRSAAVTKQRVVKHSRRTSKETSGGFRLELVTGAEVDMILAGLLGNAFAGDPLTAKAGGLNADTFTLERQLAANDYRRFSGVALSSAEFTIAPEANIMCRVTTNGATRTTGSAALAGATYADPSATEKLNALDVLPIVLAGGISTSYDFATLSFTVNNQNAVSKRLGANPVRRIRRGQVLVTGTMSLFINDKTLADAADSDTRFSMDVPLLFGGAGYTMLFKNVSITDYNDNNTGNNDEFMGAIGFEATLDTTGFGTSFAVAKTTS